MLNHAALNLMIERAGGRWLPYAYESKLLVLDNADAKVVTQEIELADSKGFIWAGGMYKTNMASLQAGTDILYGGLSIKFDGASNYGQLGKESFTLDAMFSRGGTSGDVRALPIPLLIEDRSTIGFEITNRTGLAVNLRLTFIGAKRT